MGTEIDDAIERNAIRLVRFLWVDHSGIVRGKATTVRQLATRLKSGIGMTIARQAANLLDQVQRVPGFNAVGEVRMMADPDSFVVLPHAPGSAAMISDLATVDGEPWEGCPRLFLKQAVSAAAAEGLDIIAAFEPEFTLGRRLPEGSGPIPFTPLDDSLCFSAAGFDAANDFAVEVVPALESLGLEVELYHPEFAAGQQEITVRPVPALQAADQFVWYREVVRGLAARRGLWASFAPKPLPNLRPNGNHIHVSAWRDGQNLFADPANPLGLSELAHHFVAGVLAHLPALVALTCPTVNSYRRLAPRSWAGGYRCYGLDNREAAVRVPSTLAGRSIESTNIELKAADGTVNPYLALGGMIFAGLDGVRRRLDPGPPMEVDPNELSVTELARRGVTLLPRSLAEAVAELERDEYLMDLLGPLRAAAYPAVKRADVLAFASADDREYATHANRF